MKQYKEQGKHLDNVVIGKIVSMENILTLTDFTLTKVDIGEGDLLLIVCGHQTSKLGDKVVVAKIRTVLPEISK